MKDFADKNPDRSGWTMINLMDEPGFEFDHVEGCPACQQGFAPYLKSLGLPDPRSPGSKSTTVPTGPAPKRRLRTITPAAI